VNRDGLHASLLKDAAANGAETPPTRATDARSARRIGQALGVVAALLLVATLVTSLAKQLAVLLLRHALTALLDDRTHGKPH
jgi:lysylphosphatidylglycerol synthetase-like protein (DUF2156 family)